MKIYLKLLLAGLLTFALIMGCKKKDKVQYVAPQESGERGNTCLATNDCGSDLACINGSCQPANFDVDATGKHCVEVHCETTEQCCGDKPTEAPTKCRRADSVCTPTVAGCPAGITCTDNSACGGGTCAGLSCDWTGFSCGSTDDCEQDECVFPSLGLGGGAIGECSLSFGTCTSDADCTLTNECIGTGICTCSNPNYDPLDPICSDPDCENVCVHKCEDRRCMVDDSCEEDVDCFSGQVCADSGRCVECELDTDCDSALDDTDDLDVCRPEGFCETPCKGDSECPEEFACEAGDCVYVGCRSDRECILSGKAMESGDRRLSVCVEGPDGIGVCKISCEIDNHCPVDQICDNGACKYIGCDDDVECKEILNLHNRVTSPDEPWLVEGKCEVPVVAE